MLITIQELLVRCGFPKDAKAKLVRHKDHRQNVYDLYRFHRDKFEDYQAIQSKPVFHELDYIVSFIGEEGRRARFVGVYRVLRVQPIEEVRQTIENPNDKYFYTLEEVGGFERLKELVKPHLMASEVLQRDGGHRNIFRFRFQAVPWIP